jgi:hypothetical protein
MWRTVSTFMNGSLSEQWSNEDAIASKNSKSLSLRVSDRISAGPGSPPKQPTS